MLTNEELDAIFVPNTNKYHFGPVDSTACAFNGSVDCNGHDNCLKCGWNPAVDEKRKALIRAKLNAGDCP